MKHLISGVQKINAGVLIVENYINKALYFQLHDVIIGVFTVLCRSMLIRLR